MSQQGVLGCKADLSRYIAVSVNTILG